MICDILLWKNTDQVENIKNIGYGHFGKNVHMKHIVEIYVIVVLSTNLSKSIVVDLHLRTLKK